MLLHELYQFQGHGLIGLGTHVGNKFQGVVFKPQILKQVHGTYYIVIGRTLRGTEYDRYAVLTGYGLHELCLTAVRAVYRQESCNILLIVQPAQRQCAQGNNQHHDQCCQTLAAFEPVVYAEKEISHASYLQFF